MTNRVEIDKSDNGLLVTIKAFKDEAKQKMLLVWIILFSLCGIFILAQFFYDYDRSSKLFFAVYLAFWMFFEFKVVYAYRWRLLGVEKIKISSSEFSLTKEIGKRGITQVFELNEVGNVRLFESDEHSFIKAMNSSYWNINKYSLVFDYKNQPNPFAIDLEKNEAKKLLKEIEQFIRAIKKS